jgi:hypothetical protein
MVSPHLTQHKPYVRQFSSRINSRTPPLTDRKSKIITSKRRESATDTVNMSGVGGDIKESENVNEM